MNRGRVTGFHSMMTPNRPDLHALTPDDLAVLTNRGTVKRAQREVETAEVSAEWETDDGGRVVARWSDEVVCELPAGRTVKEAQCSCPAAELCRHVVRTVLAWQRLGDASSTPEPAAAWNPGSLSDAHLESHAAKGLMAKAQQRWNDGALVECVTGAKPSARFYDLGLTVRFVVPGDVRYSHCDCGQPSPCLHALLAVRAFRAMPADQTAALVSSGSPQIATDEPLLAEAERAVLRLLEDGIGGVASSEAHRWHRTAKALHGAGLVWLAGLLEDLLRERERYAARDALFAPENLAALAGELLMRCDALRHCTALPRGLAGGWRTTEQAEVGYSRWIGMGTLVTVRRKSVTLAAFMQEAGTGSPGAVMREVAHPADGAPQDFAAMARVGMVKGAGIRALGAGQVIAEGCRRTPDHRLAFGRARAQVSPQSFEWEKLRAPVLVEDFAELRARLSLLPPRSLRPRRIGEDFHVLPVAANTAASFDPATQTLTAELTDTAGQRVKLALPWHARAAAGLGRLTAGLTENAAAFVSGAVSLTPAGLAIVPAGVVLRGAERTLVQPWVDERAEAQAVVSSEEASAFSESPPDSPLPPAWRECGELLADLLVTGCSRAREDRWRQLAADSEPAGSLLSAQSARGVAESLRRAREGAAASTGDAAARALVAWRAALDV